MCVLERIYIFISKRLFPSGVQVLTHAFTPRHTKFKNLSLYLTQSVYNAVEKM